MSYDPMEGFDPEALIEPDAPRPIRMLTITSLFPSLARPRHGIFVETRLQQLIATRRVSARVIAPVPWFPSTRARFGRYADFARTPLLDIRSGIPVSYPRYLMIPAIGQRLAAASMAHAVLGYMRRNSTAIGAYDLIDGQYLYPDGVAAAKIAARLRCPYVLTARGSDVNVIAKNPAFQTAVLKAIEGASFTFTVSNTLRRSLIDLGCAPDRIICARNGVDTQLFHPVDQAAARKRLGISAARLIVSVGNLVAEKRHALVIRALPRLTGTSYVIVGNGPERARLLRLAASERVADRVCILDTRPQVELVDVYAAADVLVLPSSREGWPNVLLEALACGTPVVASAVGGVADIVSSSIAGIVLESDSPDAFASAIKRVLDARRDRMDVSTYAKRFDWRSVAVMQAEFCHAAATGQRGRRGVVPRHAQKQAEVIVNASPRA